MGFLCIFNDFDLRSVNPRNTIRDMNQITAKDIFDCLEPLQQRWRGRRGEIEEEIAAMIPILRLIATDPPLDTNSIEKNTANLRKALEPIGDGLQIPIPLEGKGMMTLREFRAALDWLADKFGGASSKVNLGRFTAAAFAEDLIKRFAQFPPTGTVGGPLWTISSLLYEAATGEAERDLKRQVDIMLAGRDLPHLSKMIQMRRNG